MSAGPALAALEIDGLARGRVVLDAALKRAEVEVLWAADVTPGKHVILLRGEVAETEEALGAAIAAAEERLVDRLLLPQAHAELWLALKGPRQIVVRSLGLVETVGIAGALRAADAACKAAEVELSSLELARGIGGKGFFAVTGEQDAVEAALDAAAGSLDAGGLIERQLIARPHSGLHGTVPKLFDVG